MRTALLLGSLVARVSGFALLLPYYRWRAGLAFRRSMRRHRVPPAVARELCQDYMSEIRRWTNISSLKELAR